MTGQPGATVQKGKKKKDGFRGDSSEQDGSLASPAKLPSKAKQAWDTGPPPTHTPRATQRLKRRMQDRMQRCIQKPSQANYIYIYI